MHAAVRILRGLPSRQQQVDGSSSFFFQAEDGIRDLTVTGVQTCALPILSVGSRKMGDRGGTRSRRAPCGFAHLQLFVTHCEAGCPDGAVYLACRLGYRSVHEHGEGPLALDCRGRGRVGGFDEIPGGSQRPMACGSALDTSRMAWGAAGKGCGGWD